MTPMVEMADNSIAENNVETVIESVNKHFDKLLRDRYADVAKLYKTKDESTEKGRAYVMAYVQYTHTLEALEHILHEPISHSGEEKNAGKH